MKRASSVAVSLCVMLTSVAPLPPQAGVAAQQPTSKYRSHTGDRLPDQYVVVLRDDALMGPGSDEDTVAAIADDLTAAHGGRRRHVYRHALAGFSVRLPAAAARRLSEDPRVAYVEEDGVTYAAATQAAPQNWGLDRIDQRHLPRDSRYEYRADGTGVNVYIVDSGVYAGHTTFEGRAVGAYDAVGDGVALSDDCHGHGTHVAGIAGSSLYGVAKNVALYSVRAVGCTGTGSWSDYIEALDWVAGNHLKPAVVNASIGGATMTATNDAILRLTQAGVTFVGAAGNQGTDACTQTPASAPAAIAVGNATDQDTRAVSSNYGPCVDIYAPGTSIYSTHNEDPDAAMFRSGTSMAAPHVTGAVALYLQGHPTATPAEVREHILRGATIGAVGNHVAGPNLLLFTGYLGDITPPSVTFTSPAPSSTVSGPATLSAAASDDVELLEVRFYAGDTMIGVDASTPFSVTWATTSVPDGNYVLRAAAVDLAGNTSASSLAVTVRNGWDVTRPTVSVTSPLAGATLSGTVTLAATAMDDVAVARVEFHANGASIGTDASAPYSVVWNTATVVDEQYSVTARAFDTAGNAQLSAPVVVRVQNAGILPTGWTSNDVGITGRVGSASYDSGTFSIQAGGIDVWGTADAFHFVHRSWTGDGEVIARVGELSLPSGASFALAGIMLRESLTSNARHAALLIGTDGKLKFRRRTVAGGTTLSDGPSAGSVAVPYWLKIKRAGNLFTAYRSQDGAAWTQTGPATTIGLPATVRVGVWTLRNGGTALAAARLTHVSVTAPAATLPAGWTNHDVGSAAPAGTAAYANGVFTVSGSGADIWSTSDAFHFVHRTWSGDGDIVARLSSLVPPAGAAWAMGGIMMRESLAGGAVHATLLIGSDGKLKFRRRLLANGTTLSHGPSAGSTKVPRWLKLSRRGSIVSAYSSPDGTNWTAVHVPETMSLPADIEVGVWTLRNGSTGVAQAQFSNVALVTPSAGTATGSR